MIARSPRAGRTRKLRWIISVGGSRPADGDPDPGAVVRAAPPRSPPSGLRRRDWRRPGDVHPAVIRVPPEGRFRSRELRRSAPAIRGIGAVSECRLPARCPA